MVERVDVRIEKDFKYFDVDDLTPLQGKLKGLSDENFNKLRKSILEKGFKLVLHVWQSGGVNYLIDGHQRAYVLQQLKKQGYEVPEIPCAMVQARTYSEAKETVLLAVSQYGKIDKEGFDEFIEGEDFDLDDFDFPDVGADFFDVEETEEEKQEREEKEDSVPDIPENDNPYGVQRGQVWKLGKHRIMCGDSTSEADVSKLMDGDKADLLFTDPPYNQETEGGFKSEIGKALKKQSSDIEHLCNFEPKKTLAVIPSLFLKNRMNAFLFCNKDLVPEYLNWSVSNKYMFNILIWKKPSGIPIGGSYVPDVEYLLVFRKSGIFNRIEGCVYSKVLEHKRETGLHPTMKPIDMIENQLLIASNKGSIVADLFLGSGSTLIACEKTNRTCYGMEIDEHYMSVIIKRWEEYTGQTAERIE